MWRRLNRILTDLSAHLALLSALGLGGMVTIAMAWAAYVTEQLRPYAPLSWITAALLGAAIFSILYWLICKGRSLWISANVDQAFYSTHPSNINPLQDTFQRQRININDLVGPFERIIRRKTFIDCDIIGPANITLGATTPGGGFISGASLFECAGILMKNQTYIPFGIMLEDCTFVRGRMYGLLLFISENGYKHIVERMHGLQWITLDMPTDIENK